MNEKYIGSDFDDFLREEGILAETETTAIQRVLAFQIEQLMKEQRISKAEMAERMQIDRAEVEQLLNPSQTTTSVYMLERAALALGKRLEFALV